MINPMLLNFQRAAREEDVKRGGGDTKSSSGLAGMFQDVVSSAANAVGVKDPTLYGIADRARPVLGEAQQAVAQIKPPPSIEDLKQSLLGQAKQFQQAAPKYIGEQTEAKSAQLAQEARQQQRMMKSQAAAGGQIGSGQMKIKYANLSAGAKYAYVAAKADIEAKIKAANDELQQEAINKAQSLEGLTFENAQRQYEIEMQNIKNRSDALRSLAGVAGYGIGTYLGSKKDT